MSRRNFTLLIIILIIIAVVAFLLFYFWKKPSTPIEDSGGTNFFSNFNPFGKGRTTTPPEETPVDIGEPDEPIVEVPVKLRKVSSMPIAGYGVFTKERFKEIPVVIPPVEDTSEIQEGVPTADDFDEPSTTPISKPIVKTPPKKPTPPPTEFMTAVRYAARASGNIYQTFADKLDERKFSSTVIPKVYDAYFGTKAEQVLMRYLQIDDRTIETFAGSLPKEILGADNAAENELSGAFLPENIKDISISPDLSKMFYLFESGDGVVGITSGILGDKRVQVFDSPFTEWLSQWPNVNLIALTTKPSSGIPGYMYAINPVKKDFKKILGNINGLTTLTSPNGKIVLYSNSNLSLSAYDISAKKISTLGVNTLPEKCVWTKTNDLIYCAVPKFTTANSMPDDWYKGEISFSDDIWVIDTKSGSTTILVDPLSVVGGEDIDGIKLALDKDEKYLFFVNKKNSFLWELDLQ